MRLPPSVQVEGVQECALDHPPRYVASDSDPGPDRHASDAAGCEEAQSLTDAWRPSLDGGVLELHGRVVLHTKSRTRRQSQHSPTENTNRVVEALRQR